MNVVQEKSGQSWQVKKAYRCLSCAETFEFKVMLVSHCQHCGHRSGFESNVVAPSDTQLLKPLPVRRSWRKTLKRVAASLAVSAVLGIVVASGLVVNHTQVIYAAWQTTQITPLNFQ